ncbi:hypothetical protein [Streptomyces sp. NPDC003077]|uniref:hypothetical protein n=1 Tax=Streptomyces sp. NPDC003077 TaxID=3154443 RepID=UPI0033A1BB84
MRAHLAETAHQLAAVLWQRHTVYRERSGTMVIRGDHVQRWISLAPTGSQDQVLIRAGRILDGGTTAPARSEIVIELASGTQELAAACRRLLAEAASAVETPTAAAPRPQPEARRRRRGKRRIGLGSWLVIVAATGILVLAGLNVYSAMTGH